MSLENPVEIIAQPAQLSEEHALEQVHDRVIARLKSTVNEVGAVRAVLRYKPFYSYDVTLAKRVFRGNNVTTEGCIVVDAMADVARPFTTEEIEEAEITVSDEQVLDPHISKEEALQTANSRRMQVEHRERGNVDIDEEPQLVYKPAWIVELSNGDLRVVDAVEGTVFSDFLLG